MYAEIVHTIAGSSLSGTYPLHFVRGQLPHFNRAGNAGRNTYRAFPANIRFAGYGVTGGPGCRAGELYLRFTGSGNAAPAVLLDPPSYY